MFNRAIAPVTLAIAISGGALPKADAQQYQQPYPVVSNEWRPSDQLSSTYFSGREVQPAYQTTQFSSYPQYAAPAPSTPPAVSAQDMGNAFGTLLRGLDGFISGCNRYALIAGSVIGTLLAQSFLLSGSRAVVNGLKNRVLESNTTIVERRGSRGWF